MNFKYPSFTVSVADRHYIARIYSDIVIAFCTVRSNRVSAFLLRRSFDVIASWLDWLIRFWEVSDHPEFDRQRVTGGCCTDGQDAPLLKRAEQISEDCIFRTFPL